MKVLTKMAEPPLSRLEAIARRLENTGTFTADIVNELRQVIAVMYDAPAGIDAHTARSLAYAAEVLGNGSFSTSASQLAHAAEILPRVVGEMSSAASRMSQFR